MLDEVSDDFDELEVSDDFDGLEVSDDDVDDVDEPESPFDDAAAVDVDGVAELDLPRLSVL